MTRHSLIRGKFIRGKGTALGSAAVLAVSVLAVAASTTSASANLAGSSFEGGDGNLVVNTSGNTDWANVSGLNTGTDIANRSGDNAFGQGTKEDQAAATVVDGSIPPNKNDLSRFYESSSLGANSHNYLNLGWQRLVNIGNANLDFEINQAATAGFTDATSGPVTLARTAGDLLVTYDFGGSGTPTLGLDTWLTADAGNTVAQCLSANALPCWGKHLNLGTNAEGAVNTSPVVDPVQAGSPTLGVGLFGEASIDLTAAGVFPAGTCRAFGSAFVKSRSSSSFTAEIKDFIAPIPVNISNCGEIKVHKVTENGDASFSYSTTGGLSPSTFNLSNGGVKDYKGVPAGSYSVSEGALPTDWTLKSLVCTATGTGTSASVSTATASITMAGDGLVDCTYTNHNKLSPSISTLLSATSAPVGSSVNDTSTLTGASAHAGGTVTYTVYTDDQCTTDARSAGTKDVTDGVVPDSNPLTFDSAGTYYWQAVYSGDVDNKGATSACTDEKLLITKAPTSVTTAQNLIPNDSFMLSGATSGAGGTITMSLYAPGDATCSGTPAFTQTVPVSGSDTYATSNSTFKASTEGTWRWASTYTGDANNTSATSTCGTEHFTIANN